MIRDDLDKRENRFSVDEIHGFDWGEWVKYFGDIEMIGSNAENVSVAR